MNNLPKTRREALSLGETQYFTGRACPNGHIAARYTFNSCCVSCKSEYTKGWRKENEKHTKETSRLWNSNNPEKVKAIRQRANKKRKTTNPQLALWTAVRRRAQRQGINFEIEVSDIEMPLVCPVLGLQLNYLGGNGSLDDCSASVDRIDPNKGYIRGNIKTISFLANKLKGMNTTETLMKLTTYLNTVTTEQLEYII